MRPFFKLSFLLFFFSVSCFGVPSVSLLDTKTHASVPWKVSFNWKWLTSKKNVHLLAPEVTITTGIPIASITGRASVIKLTGDKIAQLLLVGMSDVLRVKLKGGDEQEVALHLNFSETEVITKGCEEFIVQPPWNDEINAYIGVYCETVGSDHLITVSAPSNLTWDETNIFERDGKGKQWKLFSWGDVGEGTGKIAFNLKAKEQKGEFQINRKYSFLGTAVGGNPFQRYNLTVGLGLGLNSLSTPLTSHTSYQPNLMAEFSLPISIFRPGIATLLSVPLPGNNSQVSFYDVETYLGIPIRINKKFTIDPRGYFVLMGTSYSPASISYSYQYYNPGIGMDFQYQLDAIGDRIRVTIVTSGYLPSANANFLGFDVGFDFGSLGTLTKGLLFTMRQETYSLADGNRTFQQFMLNGVFRL